MTPRKKLLDILRGDDRQRLAAAWDSTKAAEDFAPLPSGQYIAHVVGGELTESRTKATPDYKLTFRVAEGEHVGRQFWHDIWLTEAALPMAKRDLGKLGVTSLDQLENPLPQGIRCKVKLALRKDDDGAEYNRVRSFEVVGIDAPTPDTFAPTDDANGGNGELSAAAEAEGDMTFDPAQLEAAALRSGSAYDPEKDG